MRAPADIAVYDENDQISALVEVRAVPESSSEWATEIRREILDESGFIPRCFLVVARDAAYIWTLPKSADVPPDEVVATDALFEKYLKDIHSTGQSIAPSSLELMVGIWLSDLAQTGEPSASRLGLSSVVANGRVEFLAAA